MILHSDELDSRGIIELMLSEILKTLQNNIKEDLTNKVPNKVPNKIPNKSEFSVLRLLKDNPRLTRLELAANTALTDSAIKKIISTMKTAGWIKRIGSNKSGYWIVKYDIN